MGITLHVVLLSLHYAIRSLLPNQCLIASPNKHLPVQQPPSALSTFPQHVRTDLLTFSYLEPRIMCAHRHHCYGTRPPESAALCSHCVLHLAILGNRTDLAELIIHPQHRQKHRSHLDSKGPGGYSKKRQIFPVQCMSDGSAWHACVLSESWMHTAIQHCIWRSESNISSWLRSWSTRAPT